MTNSTNLLQHLSKIEKELWVAWENDNGAVYEKHVKPECLSIDHFRASVIAGSNKIVEGKNVGDLDLKKYLLTDFNIHSIKEGIVALTYQAKDVEVIVNQKEKVAFDCIGMSLYVSEADEWKAAMHQDTVTKMTKVSI